MKNFCTKYITKGVLLILLVILIGGSAYGAYEYSKLWKSNSYNLTKITSLEANLEIVRANLETTKGYLSETELAKLDLESELDFQQERVEDISEKFEEVSDTVQILDKLSKTDKELLQKYSKVYFLNEHFIPDSLATVQTTHTYSNYQTEQIHAKAFPHLIKMLDDAAAAGVPLYVKSGYRSFGEQSELKSYYTVVYGSGANTFAADQGYSEHQLGTTADLIGPGSGGILDEGFANTPQYTWLQKNAHKYGFTLSYPQGNSYYVFEPWHWRYVGVKLATALYNDGSHFYDWDQRDINEYLISIFD